jgi:hypothetical protein
MVSEDHLRWFRGTHIRPTYTSRNDAYDDISCVLYSRNASIFVPEAEVAVKHERRVALEQDEYMSANLRVQNDRLTTSIFEVAIVIVFMVQSFVVEQE